LKAIQYNLGERAFAGPSGAIHLHAAPA
jgi:hypothetical protein